MQHNDAAHIWFRSLKLQSFVIQPENARSESISRSAIAVVVVVFRRFLPGFLLTVAGKRRYVLGVTEHLGHATEAAALDTNLLHQRVDHRRLNTVAQSGINHFVGDVAARISAIDAVDVKNLYALDLLQRLDAFAHDAFDALQKLFSQPRGAGGLSQYVFGFVKLTGTRCINLVTFRGRERANFLRLRRCFGGDLLRFGKASCRTHFRFGLCCDPKRLALGLALGGNHLGELSALGDFPLARGYRLLLSLDDLDAHRLGSGDRGRALGGLFGQFDHLDHFRHFDQLVPLGRQRSDVAILGDPRLFDAALGADARTFDLLGGRNFRLLERLPFGNLQALEIAFTLNPNLVEHPVLRDTLRFGTLALDNLSATLFRLRFNHSERLFRQCNLPIKLQNLQRLLARDFQFALLALARDPSRLQLQFEVDLFTLGLLAGLQLGLIKARRRAISRRWVSSSLLMRSWVMASCCTNRAFSTAWREESCASSASCSRTARSLVSSARCTARRNSTSRSCSSRAYSVSRSISKTFFCASRF